jgi:hypothetical protein
MMKRSVHEEESAKRTTTIMSEESGSAVPKGRGAKRLSILAIDPSSERSVRGLYHPFQHCLPIPEPMAWPWAASLLSLQESEDTFFVYGFSL